MTEKMDEKKGYILKIHSPGLLPGYFVTRVGIEKYGITDTMDTPEENIVVRRFLGTCRIEDDPVPINWQVEELVKGKKKFSIYRHIDNEEVLKIIEKGKKMMKLQEKMICEAFAKEEEEYVKLKQKLGIGQDNPMVECACGCGQLRPKYDKKGIERKYIRGHVWGVSALGTAPIRVDKNKVDFEDFMSHITDWLNKTQLSENAKNVLKEETVELYSKTKEILNGKKEQIAKTAIFLACDKRLCAIPRILPKPKVKDLSKVRKRLRIPHVDAIGRINSLCKLLGFGEDVSNKAKQLLLRYKNSYPSRYNKGSPTNLAVTSVYVSSILCGVRKYTQPELCANTGISVASVHSISRRLASVMDKNELKELDPILCNINIEEEDNDYFGS